MKLRATDGWTPMWSEDGTESSLPEGLPPPRIRRSWRIIHIGTSAFLMELKGWKAEAG
jgi:hypothetical protein